MELCTRRCEDPYTVAIRVDSRGEDHSRWRLPSLIAVHWLLEHDSVLVPKTYALNLPIMSSGPLRSVVSAFLL